MPPHESDEAFLRLIALFPEGARHQAPAARGRCRAGGHRAELKTPPRRFAAGSGHVLHPRRRRRGRRRGHGLARRLVADQRRRARARLSRVRAGVGPGPALSPIRRRAGDYAPGMPATDARGPQG